MKVTRRTENEKGGGEGARKREKSLEKRWPNIYIEGERERKRERE